MSISRRRFCAAVGAAVATPSLAWAQGRDFKLLPPFDPNTFRLKIVPSFENRPAGRPLSREIIFCLDQSGSMKLPEIKACAEGVLLGLRNSRLLSTDPNDRHCAGPIGLGFVGFNDVPLQKGYMILNSAEDIDRALVTINSLFPVHGSGGTNPAGGLHMARHMFLQSPCRAPFPHQRMVFLMGDEGQKVPNYAQSIIDYDPLNRVMELALYEGSTTHCVEMGTGGHYADIPTMPGLNFQAPDRAYAHEIPRGDLIQARSAAEIAAFVTQKIDPNCSLALNRNRQFDASVPRFL